MLITPLVSPIVTVFSTASSAINSAGIWLNACVHFNINEQWHDDSDRSGSPVSPAEQAESMIPFTEDCRRCVKELIRILGAVKQAELISAGLAKILPGLPVDVVMAAHSLYIAVTEKRNVDMVFLNAMGLASCCTFGSNNPIPGLAHFIRETILDYTSETYFDQYLSRDDGHPSGNFFTALAVFALITRYWLTDEGAPQRRLLKMPIFFGNLLIRVNCYWHLLSNMAQRGAAAYIAPATRGDLPESAFEVDTFVRITHKNDERLSQHTFSKTNMPNALSGKFTGKTELLAFHSNSTVYPESLTKATANNKFSPVPEANHNDAARALHAWSVEKLKQRHKIAELQNCNTKITRTYEREINNIVLNSQLNTKCDAVAVVPPLLTTKSGYSGQKGHLTSVNVVANAVVNPQKSVAGGGGSNDVRIPLMTAAALATTAYAPHSVLSGKKFMVALGSLALTTIVGGARALYNFINSIESVGSTVSGNQRSSDLLKSVNNSDNEVIILRINKKIIRFLRKEKILPARKNSQGNISLEKLIAAVAEYHLNNLTEKTIPLYILNSLNLFVGENTKTLTLTQAESAISSWLFGAILKKNPAEYAYREIMNDKNPSHITISSIKYLFSLEKLQADGKVDLNDLSTEMNSYFNRFWYRYTLKEMPFLYYFINESGVKSLSPGENEFADLYAGCRYLDSINALGEFNRTEVSAIGEKMWDQAIANGVGAGIQHYFLTPALLFAAQNPSDKMNGVENIHDATSAVINDYLEYRKGVQAALKDMTVKLDSYKSAVRQWLARGKLADVIIDRCSVIIPLPSLADPILTKEQKQLKGKAEAKELYMNGIAPPCKDAPTSLEDEYQKLTLSVADQFSALNEYLLYSAMRSAGKDEMDFIFSQAAVIRPVALNMNTRKPINFAYNHPCDKNIKVKLEKTNLFIVSLGNEERIYALRTGNDETVNRYELFRVDRDIHKYIENDLLDYKIFLKKYTINKNTVYVDNELFEFKIIPLRAIIKDNNQSGEVLIDFLNKQYHDFLYAALYEAGNEKSQGQNVWAVAKEMIPFYNCIEGIVNNDPIQALPSCLMDWVSFIPLLAGAARLGERFGTGFAQGVRAGGMTLSQGAISRAGPAFLQKVSLPELKELSALGKTFLRGMDPGFDLLYGLGKESAHRLIKQLKVDGKTAALAEKLEYVAQRRMQVSTAPYAMGRLPNTELMIPVKKIGRIYGKNIFSPMSPDIGMNAGAHFVLAKNGRLISLDELATNIHVSPKLKKFITPEMYARDVDVAGLSVSDSQGIRRDAQGNIYIKVKNNFVNLKITKGQYFLKSRETYIPLIIKKDRIYLENLSHRLRRLQSEGLSGRIAKPHQVIQHKLGMSEQQAKTLLDNYDFPQDSELYTEVNFALWIKESGQIPEWANEFKLLEFENYCPRFKSPSVQDNGLYSFDGAEGYAYRVDVNSPDLILKQGFTSSHDYTAIGKMIPPDEPCVIVAGDITGALRYKTLVKDSYLYKIRLTNTRGVSLKDNLMRNQDGLKLFLAENTKKNYRTIDSLGSDSQGAIYLDEMHIYKNDIDPQEISVVPIEEIQQNLPLSNGRWRNYF